MRDLDGNDQSKLLLSKPKTALAVAVPSQTPASPAPAAGTSTRCRPPKTPTQDANPRRQPKTPAPHP